MTKEILKERLREKAANRKRYLFAIYGDLINSLETTKIVLKEIQKDLGEDNLVTEADILYCRRHFIVGKRKKVCQPKVKIVSRPNNLKSVEIDELKWTNSDDMELETVRTKFIK